MTWTSPKTWNVNEIAAAAGLNTYVRDNLNQLRWASVYKSTDTSVTSDNTVNNDPHLVIPVSANETWLWTARVLWTAGAGGFRWTWTGPAGASGSFTSGAWIGAPRHWPVTQLANERTATDIAECFLFQGSIAVAGTSGDLRFAWAQNSSNAAATVVQDMSWVVARRLI